MPVRYDEAWKRFVKEFLEEVLEFMLPELHSDVDWTVAPIFEDKELDIKEPTFNDTLKRADIIAKLQLKNGESQVIWLHVELQNTTDKALGKRMYGYYKRMSHDWGEDIVSIAILTGKNRDSGKYVHGRYGTKNTYEYNVFCLLDCDIEELERSKSPVALILRAARFALDVKESGRRWAFLRELGRLAMENGIDDATIRGIISFLTRIFQLKKNDVEELQKAFGGGDNMRPYELKPEERTWFDDLYDKAVETGRQDGERKGELKGELKVIKNMLNKGFSFAQASEFSGFSETKLRGLLGT